MNDCIIKKTKRRPHTTRRSRYGVSYPSMARATWIDRFGPIPRGMQVLHSCDNKFCINLDHLHLGTHADNMREARERFRFKRGTQLPWAKLDATRVRLIRQLLSEGHSQTLIAELFGVSQVAISKIKRGKSWKVVS